MDHLTSCHIWKTVIQVINILFLRHSAMCTDQNAGGETSRQLIFLSYEELEYRLDQVMPRVTSFGRPSEWQEKEGQVAPLSIRMIGKRNDGRLRADAMKVSPPRTTRFHGLPRDLSALSASILGGACLWAIVTTE
jgi:hypothetical protein